MSLFIADPTPVDRPTDVCPDPAGHLSWHEAHELTIRRCADGTPILVKPGFCPYCGKRLP